MPEYPVTGNVAIDEDIPGVSIIDYDENACSDNDIGERLPHIAKWIRSLVQNDNFDDVKNIFGDKDIPCHYSYDEIVEGYAAKGHTITIAEADKVAKRCTAELRALGMTMKYIPHPEIVPTSGLVERLMKLIEDDTNVLLYGPAGVGKTAMVDQACVALGMVDKETGKVDPSRVKYFSTATLAPEDFVGIPAPNPDNPATFKYLQMDGFANAEVMILDELNRAHPKVLNGVFQILQGRAINDTPLRKLKTVIAMINPIDDGNYTGAEDLDDALIDRFDHFIPVNAEPSASYLASQFAKIKGVSGEDAQEVADAVVDWWKQELTLKKNKDQISPRRLEKIGRAYLLNQGIGDTIFAKKCQIPLTYLQERLRGRNLLTAQSLADDPHAAMSRILAGTDESMELALRARTIISQYYARQDFSRMSKALPVLDVLDKDALTTLQREPNLLDFVKKSAKRTGQEAWLDGLFKASDEGLASLQERRKQIAAQLAAAAASDGDGKVTL